jgi:hypothetical protein
MMKTSGFCKHCNDVYCVECSKFCVCCRHITGTDHCTECGDETVELKVEATLSLSNSFGVGIYYIDDNTVVYKFTNSKPQVKAIKEFHDYLWKDKGLESPMNMGFKEGKTVYFLSDFIIV